MNIISKIRDYAARRAHAQQLYAEMASMSDAELNDLNLSHAKLLEMSRQQAIAA